MEYTLSNIQIKRVASCLMSDLSRRIQSKNISWADPVKIPCRLDEFYSLLLVESNEILKFWLTWAQGILIGSGFPVARIVYFRKPRMFPP